jgi:hypothetical protein
MPLRVIDRHASFDILPTDVCFHPLPLRAASGTCRGPDFFSGSVEPSAGIAPK